MLQAKTPWSWTKQRGVAFQQVKELVDSETVLTHFNPARPMILACDTSAYSLGAVLSQTTQDGVERPVAFASRTLTKAEKGYAQIDKEGLALTWGIILGNSINTYMATDSP